MPPITIEKEKEMDIIFNTRTFFVTPISGIEYEFPTSVSIYIEIDIYVELCIYINFNLKKKEGKLRGRFLIYLCK